MAGIGILTGTMLVVIPILAYKIILLIMWAVYLCTMIIKSKNKFKSNSYIIAILSLISILTGYCNTNSYISIDILQSLIDDNQQLPVIMTGTVEKIIHGNGYNQLWMYNSIIEYDNKQYTESVIVTTDGKDDIRRGDKINVSGKLKCYEEPSNEGQFDSKAYYSSIGFRYKLSANNLCIIERCNNHFVNWLEAFKEKMLLSYDRLCDSNDAGFFKALVLGDKATLDEGIKQMFQDAGISHILAISGLHISIIGMFLYKLLRRCNCSHMISSIVGSIMIITFGIMIGNGLSATRAIVMFLLSIWAITIGRNYDILTATTIAGIILLLKYPLIILNCGFLLSFAAILGIVLMYPVIMKVFETIVENLVEHKTIQYVTKLVIEGFAVSISINIFTLPIVLYYYYQFPTYSIILNFLVLPLMPIVIISAIAGGIVGIYWSTAGTLLIGAAHYTLSFYTWLCSIISRLPYNILTIGRPKLISIITYIILIIIVIIISKKLAKTIMIQSSVGLLLVIAVISLGLGIKPDFKIAMLDIGQGDCSVINVVDKVIVIDSGSTDKKDIAKNIVVPYINSLGYDSVDTVIISHMDSDHISGIKEIINNQLIEIKSMLIPDIDEKDDAYIELENMALSKGIEVSYMHMGDVVSWCNDVDNAVFTCINPIQEVTYNDRNAYSLSGLFEYKGLTMAFTGDIGEEQEKMILEEASIREKLIETDILKTAHHGSMFSSCDEWIKVLKPQAALISAGRDNSYGHPHQELINRLEDNAVSYYVTSSSGQISIYYKKNIISIVKLINKKERQKA